MKRNVTLLSLFAKRFPAGRWSFLGPGSEKKWYSVSEDSRQGEWDRIAEQMMLTFGESGHPVFRATCPVSRGTLKSKGGGQLSIHFCADGEMVETVFRTIISVNQLCIYGAVSDLCDEYSACQARTVRPIVRASKIVDDNTHTFDRSWVQRTSGKALTTKPCDQNFVLMQDSWQQLKSDSTSWQRTLKSSHNLQNQWHVVSTLCQEMKNNMTRKVGFEGIPILGPCLESQPATYKVNMELRSEFGLHGSNKFVMNLNNNETEIPEDQLEKYALKLDVKDFACRSKAKAKPQRREPPGSSPRIVPIGRRNWIDIEPGKYSLSDYEVSKRKSEKSIPTISSLVWRQCKACLSYWSEGIVYCTCGHLLKEIVANRGFIEKT